MSPFAQPLGGRPVFAGSGNGNLASQSLDERRVLVKFRVDAFFKGTEVLRPITYFPICTEVLVDNDGHFTVPDVPQGPHMLHVESGVKRNEWTRGSYSMAERRYSEVLDLRELLVYQFPTIVIPPLPVKNSVKDVETFFGAGDVLMAQRANLQFFLKEISAMPEVMFFSEWVPPFFLDPRDSFETGTLGRMRAALYEMKLANRFLDDLSQRHRGFADDAADKIASTSTKLVRSVARFFWGGGGDSQRVTPAITNGSNSTSDVTVVAGNWSSLSPEANADACAWERTMALLTGRRRALRKSAKAFEGYLAAQNSRVSEQRSVAEAFDGYENTLAESDAFARLGEPCHLAVLMVEEITQKEREFSEGKYLNVCMRLAFETRFIDSVLDSIDRVLCLYRATTHNTYDPRDPAQVAWAQYTAEVSKGLRGDYVKRYKRYYTRRMRNLVLEQITRPSTETATAVERSLENSAFTHLVRDPSFTSYNGHSA